MPLLRVSEVFLQEQGNAVLHDISFTQETRQKLAIAGETGAGKSTLLQVVAGLVQPSTGEVWFDGRRVKGPATQLLPGHPGIAYLSQHFELPKFLRVEQVLRYASTLPETQAEALYEVCRIRHLAARRTDHLSGGERQRIALARLLLSSPKLLLLDEPFSNLDRGHKQLLKTVLQDLGEQLGITCTLISHDPADTLSWADEIVVLRAGRLVQQGPPPHVYHRPANEYTAGLFGDYNLITGALASALAKLAGSRKKRASMLVRPEQFQVRTAGGSGLPGTVQAVRFFGSYYELDVALLGSNIRVKTEVAGWALGDAVAVSVRVDGLWHV